MNDQKAATLERIGRIKQDSISSLWHEMLRTLSYDERKAWHEAGYPSDPYADGPCKFCELLGEDRQRERRHAKSVIAKAEQIAQDALARARKASGPQLPQGERAAAPSLAEIAELAKAFQQDVHVELPEAPAINIHIDKDLLAKAEAATLEYDENDVTVEQDGNVIRVKSNR